METDDGQERRRQNRADQAFQIVGEPGERQRLGVLPLVWKHVRDRRLEGRREPGGGRLEHEDQDVDLPDLSDEREEKCDRSADDVKRDQHGPTRKSFREGGRHRCDGDICDHLDCQRRAQHRPSVLAGQVEGEQA